GDEVGRPAAGMAREQPAGALKPTGHLAKIIDDDGREVHQAVPLVLHVAEGRGGKVRSHELASMGLGRDLMSPELSCRAGRSRAGRARLVMTAAPNSGSGEQMFGAE